jgi:uncharacterized protein (TIGR02996 family)
MRQEDFIHAIIDDWGDDVPRLAYADWLEERGDPYGEFIRLGCARARGSARSREAARQEALLARYEEEWFGPLRALGRLNPSERGFVNNITIEGDQGLRRFVAGAKEIARTCLLQQVLLRPGRSPPETLDPQTLRGFAALPCLGRVRSLLVAGYYGDADAGSFLDVEGLRALLASPHWARLKELNLANNRLGEAGARALAEAPLLAQLTGLDLSGWVGSDLDGTVISRVANIGRSGVWALASSPGTAQLRQLELSWNQAGDAGAAALAASPYLTRLTSLGFEDATLSADGRELLRGRFRDRVRFCQHPTGSGA